MANDSGALSPRELTLLLSRLHKITWIVMRFFAASKTGIKGCFGMPFPLQSTTTVPGGVGISF